MENKTREYTTNDIAKASRVSLSTARRHISRIYENSLDGIKKTPRGYIIEYRVAMDIVRKLFERDYTSPIQINRPRSRTRDEIDGED